jgi:hypothetical protein
MCELRDEIIWMSLNGWWHQTFSRQHPVSEFITVNYGSKKLTLLHIVLDILAQPHTHSTACNTPP